MLDYFENKETAIEALSEILGYKADCDRLAVEGALSRVKVKEYGCRYIADFYFDIKKLLCNHDLPFGNIIKALRLM